ncbi:MAG TPA: ribosome-associated translation inhibitor RaiA [Verrucomicrobiae bacterium]|nr:ribosome-associated translation inhibitor RaiA [Verrucomicrobiae bacterium]
MMEMTVTGRHVDITPAIREYAEKKLDHIGIDFPRVLSAHYILEVDKFRHIAELVLQCGNHITIEAREVSEDLYASIDRVVDKVMRQMRKYKTKIQRHRPRKAALYHVKESVLTHDLQEDEGTARIVHTENFAIKPMFVDEAVLQLELSETQFLVFLNAESEKVNVIYRRKKGDFGLIQPTLS